MNKDNLNLNIYKKKLFNGLDVYICPMNKLQMHASLVVKYGSDILDFKNDDKYLSIPPGSAHFLEHAMFFMEDGMDPMDLFTVNGAYGNAYTNSKITRYYFNCYTSFYENLKVLLDYINKPYFTEENILKEQGIINSEIIAGFDDVRRNIYFLTINSLFKNHPHRYPVFGNTDTILKIDKDMLYSIYKAFYRPDNMFMVLTGNVNQKEVIDYIENYYKDCNFYSNDITIKTYNEPANVLDEKKELSSDISDKLVTKAYKIKIPDGYDKFKISVYISIYLDMLFSKITKFYDFVCSDNNIIDEVQYYTEIVDNYIVIYFNLEVLENYDVLAEIDKLIKDKKVYEKDFDLVIKDILNNLIITSDKPFNTANLLINEYIEYDNIYDNLYEKYQNLDFDDFKKYIFKLNFDNSTTSIID